MLKIKLSIVLMVAILAKYNVDCASFKSSTNWDDLKITWGPNPFLPQFFVSMPRTESLAKQNGWKLEKDCSQVNGRRYIKDNDKEVILIFGQNELIAGIAISVPKNLPFNFPSPQIQPYFQDEGDSYTLNAYFVDPSTVCNSNTKQVTGDRVVIKGKSKDMNLPLTQEEIDSQTFWTKGKCFQTMGLHYWADVRGIPLSTTTPRDSFFPMFLLYNKGHLNGFGWAFNANLTSLRLEHPTPDVITNFMTPVPQFLFDPNQTGVLSTLHVFLDSTPTLNFC